MASAWHARLRKSDIAEMQTLLVAPDGASMSTDMD